MTLEQTKDHLANEYYLVPLWTLLNDSQRAALVDLVAIEFAKENIKELESRLAEPKDGF